MQVNTQVSSDVRTAMPKATMIKMRTVERA